MVKLTIGMDVEENVTTVQKVSPLAETAAYLEAIGSTLEPDDPVVRNPGKTRAELMTDPEIEKWLKDNQARIDKYRPIVESEGSTAGNAAKSFLKVCENDRKLTIEYLAKIGRLPEALQEELAVTG